MTGEQAHLAGMTSSDDHTAELRSRGDDPTPRAVPRAVLVPAMARLICVVRLLVDHAEVIGPGGNEIRIVSADLPFRVLDVCAGYGSWASEFARWWVLVLGLPREWLRITGVEIHEPRREHLRKWCDDVQICDWRRTAETWIAYSDGTEANPYDLVIGNPDFALVLRDAGGNVLPVEQTMVAFLLRCAPAVVLLHTQQAFVKSEPGRACYRANPPAASWLLPGSIKFRRGINPANGKPWGADSRCYQVTLWLRGHSGHCSTYMLEDLEAHERAWTVPPGSEDPSADLPAAPGWAP